jgi:hypothetical protein
MGLSGEEFDQAYKLAEQVDLHLANHPSSRYQGKEDELFSLLMQGKRRFNAKGDLVMASPGKVKGFDNPYPQVPESVQNHPHFEGLDDADRAALNQAMDGDAGFRAAIEANPDLLRAWQKLHNLLPNDPDGLRLDINLLKKIDGFDDFSGGKFAEIAHEFLALPNDQKKAWILHLDKRTVNGKVRSAGDSESYFGSFNNDADVPGRYSSDPKYQSLAYDPAKKATLSASRQEAMAGLEAESQGVIKGPIKRDISGGLEFIDKNGNYWDVKAPSGAFFKAKEVGRSIKRQLEKVPGSIVLLDTSYINHLQLNDLRMWLTANINGTNLSRIFEINTNLIP